MKIDEMDDLYEIVGQELKNVEERPGLMARATAEADGNPEKAKSLYIQYRVAELAENRWREAEKREADLIRQKIQDMLKRPPLSMHSCEEILTLLGFKVNTERHGRWIVMSRTDSRAYAGLYSEEDLREYTTSTATSILSSPDLKPPESSALMSQGFIPEILAEMRTCIPGFDALPFGEKVARYMRFELPERLARMHRSCPNPVDKQSASHSEVRASQQPAVDEQPSVQPHKKHANWQLRIALYIALFFAWGVAALFLRGCTTGVRNVLLEEVLTGHMGTEQAAHYAGLIAGAGQFIVVLAALSLAGLIWRKTRRA